MSVNKSYDECSQKYNMVFLLFYLAINTKFQLCSLQKREECGGYTPGKEAKLFQAAPGVLPYRMVAV